MSKAFSAPGKALLAGGYLVLEPIYNAYVTALSSRMHAIITPLEITTNDTVRRIKISSPQFMNGVWEYNIQSNYEPPKEINGRKNPFLEAVLFIVLAYAQPTTNYNLDIIIYSDPGYHTQQDTTIKTSTNGSKTFLYHSRPIEQVEKTGMGSSAGLVSVVSTALLSYFKPEIVSNKDYLHNVAQIAHCYAQKKIGSGFDVAAAIYGSIIYKRFQPSIINDIIQLHESAEPDVFVKRLKEVIESNWDFTHIPCSLPPKIRLLMGDIKGGSETPKLVSQILAWKKNKPEESSEVYKNLDEANNQFIEQLERLQLLYNQDAETYIKKINDDPSFLEPLKQSIQNMRHHLQDLTKKSQTPVEPPIQTELLDRCQDIKGCLGGIVPGAGGYDAISMLVLDDYIETVKSITNDNLQYYHEVNWVDLHEEIEGLIIENIENYIGL
ncbi:ERG8 [[Candida] subhashii]|uniref:Phosphomevalonate kinase n=1 Tax=[Candida] subhashii TaxID=561895 RepID=A0A8J5V5Z0_9ASCO|nr:ERG8 [[Candida] subhashii]KAG7666364.1 ERG8 [[Candida] subhashii]